MVFYSDYIIDNFLIPGQVENFTQIFNLGKESPFYFFSLVKDAIIHLTKHYKVRNYKAYLVNPHAAIGYFWKGILPFVNEDQAKKVIFHDGMIAEKLFEVANKEQFEERFGGKRPNMTTFWPIRQYS